MCAAAAPTLSRSPRAHPRRLSSHRVVHTSRALTPRGSHTAQELLSISPYLPISPHISLSHRAGAPPAGARASLRSAARPFGRQSCSPPAPSLPCRRGHARARGVPELHQRAPGMQAPSSSSPHRRPSAAPSPSRSSRTIAARASRCTSRTRSPSASRALSRALPCESSPGGAERGREGPGGAERGREGPRGAGRGREGPRERGGAQERCREEARLHEIAQDCPRLHEVHRARLILAAAEQLHAPPPTPQAPTASPLQLALLPPRPRRPAARLEAGRRLDLGYSRVISSHLG